MKVKTRTNCHRHKKLLVELRWSISAWNRAGSKSSLYAVSDRSAKHLGHHPEGIFRDSSLLLQALIQSTAASIQNISNRWFYHSAIFVADNDGALKYTKQTNLCFACCVLSVYISFWLSSKQSSNFKFMLFVIRNVFWFGVGRCRLTNTWDATWLTKRWSCSPQQQVC
jgi:hypothetical protein